MATPEQDDGLDDIWQQAIEHLDMRGMPTPPPDPLPPTPLTEQELLESIWYAEDDVDRWWRHIDEMPTSQPDFGPNHIKSPEELQPGMRVIWVIGEERATREMIITETDVDMGDYRGFEAIDYENWQKRYQKKQIYGEVHSYSDQGLTVNTDWMPKIGGKWATFNHLCRTGDSISEEDLYDLMQHAQERFHSGLRVFGPYDPPAEEHPPLLKKLWQFFRR